MGEGFPVILVHGFMADGSMWNGTELPNLLLKEGYQVIIPDLRGSGQSAHPEHETDYSGNAEVKDLMQLASHLGLKKYAVTGYSRGSILTAKLITIDHRVAAAILGGMGADFMNPEWPRRLELAEAFFQADSTADHNKNVLRYARQMDRPFHIMGYKQKHQPVTSCEKLKRLSIPVFLITGEHDKVNGSVKDLSNCFSKSNTHIVTDGNHGSTKNKKEFAEEIIKFLQQNIKG